MALGSLIKDVAKSAKSRAVKGISNAVFGRGLVGGALGKSFEKKFGDQEQEDTEVADALKEQESIQDNNNATLTRIETIVMNIADNIYNIAGVLNAQVVSMKEAHRLQQERAFKNAAATEEANSEALQVVAPPAAATAENTTKEKKGGITDLIGSVLSTKKLFKGFLKKFAIFAAGVTAVGLAGFAASTFMSKNDTNKDQETVDMGGAPPAGPNEPQVISSTPPGTAPGESPSLAPTVAAKSQTTSPGSTPATTGTQAAPPSNLTPTPASVPGPSAPTISILGAVPNVPAQMLEQGSNKATPSAAGMVASKAPEPVRSAPVAAPAPTPAAPPPSVAATSSADDPEAVKLEEYFNKPENAAEKAQFDEAYHSQLVIQRAISSTKSLIQSAKTPEEKAQHEAILKDQLEPGLKAAKAQKKVIVDRARKAIQPQTSAPSTPQPASGGGGSATAAAPSGGGSGGGGGGEATPISSGGGASAVPPSPSSGASIGAASTAVAAASESAPPKMSSAQINNDTTSGDIPTPGPIPTPIAGRGSLDADIVFMAGA